MSSLRAHVKRRERERRVHSLYGDLKGAREEKGKGKEDV